MISFESDVYVGLNDTLIIHLIPLLLSIKLIYFQCFIGFWIDLSLNGSISRWSSGSSSLAMEVLNYFSFPIQSNVYGLSCLQTYEGTDRLLVATLERQIFCIENKGNKFSCKEVHFTYIPSEWRLNHWLDIRKNILVIDLLYRRSEHYIHWHIPAPNEWTRLRGRHYVREDW